MSYEDNDVVVIDAVRSPMGRSRNGVFRNVRAEDISANLINALFDCLSVIQKQTPKTLKT